MAKDDRDILQILKFELEFLESGGYGRSVRTPWQPTSAFQDSVTCINFGDPLKLHPCDECLLMEFVPAEKRREAVPCHHIPLTERGETVETIEGRRDQAAIEEALRTWLRRTIARVEAERAHHATR